MQLLQGGAAILREHRRRQDAQRLPQPDLHPCRPGPVWIASETKPRCKWLLQESGKHFPSKVRVAGRQLACLWGDDECVGKRPVLTLRR